MDYPKNQKNKCAYKIVKITYYPLFDKLFEIDNKNDCYKRMIMKLNIKNDAICDELSNEQLKDICDERFTSLLLNDFK